MVDIFTINAFRTQIDELVRDIDIKISLANTYLEDGAPRSAARCLRDAADLCIKLSETRQRALDMA